jgi:hypothetical protein
VLERLSAGFGEVGADVAVPANEGKGTAERLFASDKPRFPASQNEKKARSVT